MPGGVNREGDKKRILGRPFSFQFKRGEGVDNPIRKYLVSRVHLYFEENRRKYCVTDRQADREKYRQKDHL